MDCQDKIDAIDEAIWELQRRKRYYQLLGPFIRKEKVWLLPRFGAEPVVSVDATDLVLIVRLGLAQVSVLMGKKIFTTDILDLQPAAPPATATRPRSPHLAS